MLAFARADDRRSRHNIHMMHHLLTALPEYFDTFEFLLARPGFVNSWMLKKMQTFAHGITELEDR